MADTKTKGPASYFPSIEKTYGRPLSAWKALVRARLPAKPVELVSMLKAEHGMGMPTPSWRTPWRSRATSGVLRGGRSEPGA